MKLPRVTGKDVVAALQRGGFLVAYSKGSHFRLYHQDEPSRSVTVPVHAGEIVKAGTLARIFKGAGAAASKAFPAEVDAGVIRGPSLGLTGEGLPPRERRAHVPGDLCDVWASR